MLGQGPSTGILTSSAAWKLLIDAKVFFFIIAVVNFVFKENVLLQQVLNRLYDLGRDVCGIPFLQL